MEQEGRRGLFSKGLQRTYYELRGFRALFRIYLRRSSLRTGEGGDAKEKFISPMRAVRL